MPTFPSGEGEAWDVLNATGLRKNEFEGSAPPGATDDISKEYERGSRFYDGEQWWVCVSNHLNAAVWRTDDAAKAEQTASQAIEDASAADLHAGQADTKAVLAKEVAGSIPEDFGAVGDGVADDTAAVIAWLQAGGKMTANGSYLIASAGADAGGAYATLTNSIYFSAGPKCQFIAGLGLDNDLIRLTASPSVYAAKGALDVVWQGGLFDQRLQANSTSIPFAEFYPGIRPGASATTDGLYIIAYIQSGPDYISAVSKCSVTGVTFLAGDHWQTAGGDSGLFVAGAKSTEVFGNECIGSRDCGFYGSGFPAGLIPDGTMVVRDNVFRACCMGGMVKRQFGKVVISGNRGLNTSEVVGLQGLSGSAGGGAVVSSNIGENAWHVVRLDDTVNIEVIDNISINHGHKLASGGAPTAVMNLDNAVVRLSGVFDSSIRTNTLYSVDPVASGYAAMSVVQLNGSSINASSLRNRMDGNRALAGVKVVTEVASDFSYCIRNTGSMATPVTIIGANSTDADLPGVMDAVTTTGAAVTTTQTLKTLTIPAWYLANRLDRLVVYATGAFGGTADAKTVSLVLQGVFVTFPDLPATATTWVVEAEVISTSATGVRIIASLNGVPMVVPGTIAAARPWTVDIRVRTHSAADGVSQTLMLIG